MLSAGERLSSDLRAKQRPRPSQSLHLEVQSSLRNRQDDFQRGACCIGGHLKDKTRGAGERLMDVAKLASTQPLGECVPSAGHDALDPA